MNINYGTLQVIRLQMIFFIFVHFTLFHNVSNSKLQKQICLHLRSKEREKADYCNKK